MHLFSRIWNLLEFVPSAFYNAVNCLFVRVAMVPTRPFSTRTRWCALWNEVTQDQITLTEFGEMPGRDRAYIKLWENIISSTCVKTELPNLVELGAGVSQKKLVCEQRHEVQGQEMKFRSSSGCCISGALLSWFSVRESWANVRHLTTF